MCLTLQYYEYKYILNLISIFYIFSYNYLYKYIDLYKYDKMHLLTNK